jgi:hypothetical protein
MPGIWIIPYEIFDEKFHISLCLIRFAWCYFYQLTSLEMVLENILTIFT